MKLNLNEFDLKFNKIALILAYSIQSALVVASSEVRKDVEAHGGSYS